MINNENAYTPRNNTGVMRNYILRKNKRFKDINFYHIRREENEQAHNTTRVSAESGDGEKPMGLRPIWFFII